MDHIDPDEHGDGFGLLSSLDGPGRPSDTCPDATSGESENTRVLIGKIGRGWTLKRPLLVRIERDDNGDYLVSDDLFAVYGEGANLRDSERDYAASLVEYYQLLSVRGEGDAPTAALFRRLQNYLGRTSG